MKCSEASTLLPTYVAGDLTDLSTLGELESHLGECRECSDQLEWEREVHRAVLEQDVPPPSVDFESRVLAAATGRSGGRGVHWGLAGGAIAAALVLGLFLGSGAGWWQPQEPAPRSAERTEESKEAQTVKAWEREETVKLAFNTRSRLEGVNLTIELPPHVEAQRFPGRQQLSWNVDMEPGNNIIRLPLRIAYPKEGEIVAHLGKGAKRRTFVAPLPKMHDNGEEPRL